MTRLPTRLSVLWLRDWKHRRRLTPFFRRGFHAYKSIDSHGRVKTSTPFFYYCGIGKLEARWWLFSLLHTPKVRR